MSILLNTDRNAAVLVAHRATQAAWRPIRASSRRIFARVRFGLPSSHVLRRSPMVLASADLSA
jgi:hypothetical protein